MTQTPLNTWRWSRFRYEKLVESGFFHDEHIELIRGQLIVAEPQGTYHATVLTRVDLALRSVLPPGWFVRVQLPVSLDDESAPEPDLAVVQGAPDDYLNAHPTAAALVIEVADSSLGFDREVKISLYARGGVQDYWIVNVTERTVEVYRDPQPDPSTPSGATYRSVRTVRVGDTVTPLALPATVVDVAAFFPRGGA